MRYIIRSIKYFFYFAFLTAAVVLVLVYAGLAEGDINSIFEGGYNALWKMGLFFAAVAAVYPKVGFIDRGLYIDPAKDIMPEMEMMMKERRYMLESRSADKMTFRIKGIGSRLVKMGEDRITLTRTAEGYRLEGLRKDVLRIASALEYRFGNVEHD